MIYFGFDIRSPFWKNKYMSKKINNQIDYFEKDFPISKNKNFSIQLSRTVPMNILLGLTINTQWWGQDHAGFQFEIDILGFWLHLDFYDKRHWNFAKDRWEIYPGEDDFDETDIKDIDSNENTV